ncbi:MAG: hypothetical protein A3K68_08105 [Euryarchaeota archaeon RBG_16_68_13]|nr:MAG: hypothetical protein A3K68_08105 [Euryarchaeota archaeon RBG_16_68_13]
MPLPFPTAEIREGRATLLVPDIPRRKGPITTGPLPFYNPTMVLNRDISAMVLARWPSPLRTTLDGLAASGAWGIRMALEARAGGLVLNDRSAAASALARENAGRNGVPAEVRTGDLRDLLAARSFDFVDVDPFGPPTPFLDTVFASPATNFGLGVTATDVAPLAGTYPDACVRRYAARPLRCAQGHEIGLRILLGYCARIAQSHGKEVHPLLTMSAEHFLRLFLVVRVAERQGPPPIGCYVQRADGSYGAATADDSCGVGPLWTASIADPEFVGRLSPSDVTGPKASLLLDLLKGEAGFGPFFVSTDELARRLRASPPRIGRFVEALRSTGFQAVRTHFDPRGVKTDAPAEEVLRIFRGTAPTGPTDG